MMFVLCFACFSTQSFGTKSADELHADVQERLARRRKERDERLAAMYA